MANATQYLDLDALVAVEKVLKFQGKEHPLVPVDVDTFIANVKAVQDLGATPKFEDEVNAVVRMLQRAFPSMEEATLRKIPLEHLNKILAFAQDNDGSKAVKDEAAADAAANPPAAGQ